MAVGRALSRREAVTKATAAESADSIPPVNGTSMVVGHDDSRG